MNRRNSDLLKSVFKTQNFAAGCGQGSNKGTSVHWIVLFLEKWLVWEAQMSLLFVSKQFWLNWPYKARVLPEVLCFMCNDDSSCACCFHCPINSREFNFPAYDLGYRVKNKGVPSDGGFKGEYKWSGRKRGLFCWLAPWAGGATGRAMTPGS